MASFTLGETETRVQDPDKSYSWQLGLESVLLTVSVQYEHLHTILYNPLFIGLCIGLSVNTPLPGLRCKEQTGFPLFWQNSSTFSKFFASQFAGIFII